MKRSFRMMIFIFLFLGGTLLSGTFAGRTELEEALRYTYQKNQEKFISFPASYIGETGVCELKKAKPHDTPFTHYLFSRFRCVLYYSVKDKFPYLKGMVCSDPEGTYYLRVAEPRSGVFTRFPEDLVLNAVGGFEFVSSEKDFCD